MSSSGPEPTGRGRIWRLPPQLANQIAAGEVVARPASVVKELVENAVDAQARTVRVEIEGGGIQRILVVDDGHGMTAEDAVLSLERHATSKIRSAADLQAISSFGFRGEALPSIASVCRLRLRTRSGASDAGTEVSVDGGDPPRVAPCGCAPGTSVEVAELFYNMPARRKFLRAVATESAHVGDVLRAVALAHPHVQIELRRDGRSPQRWLRADDRDGRVRAVLSDYELLACRGERGPIAVDALLSRPERARSGAGGLYLFVCGRPVQDRALSRAVATAYGETLDRGRFPVGAVFIEMPLELVDVNVHPQKAEVRFAHARAVTDAVYSVVAAGLADALKLPARPAPAAAIRPTRPGPSAADADWSWSGSGSLAAAAQPPSDAEIIPPAPAATRPWRLIAPLDEEFWLFDSGVELAFVDIDLARSLLLVEIMTDELRRGALSSQRLLFPVAREAPEPLCASLDARAEELARLGLDLRRAGPRSLVLHALPRALAQGRSEAILSHLLEALQQPSYDEPQLLRDLARQATVGGDRRDHADLARRLEERDDVVVSASVLTVSRSSLHTARAGRGAAG